MAEKKIPPSPRKPSGNVILPYAVRYRICAMIQDGAAAEAIASLISEEELSADNVIPSPFDKRVAAVVAGAVQDKAVEENVVR